MNDSLHPITALAGVMPVSLWLQHDDIAPIFPTDAAWAWFRKEHMAELVERGALLLGAGRRGDFATAETAGVVRDILLRQSIARLKRQAAHRSVVDIAATAAPTE